MSVFESAPEFIETDNRRFRASERVTYETQERRHAAMLPAEFLSGRTVLDLGCCVGATGYWCMAHQAARYTGVEVQREYADRARENLQRHFGGGAQIIQSGVEEFVFDCGERYDVVVLAGILHAFMDFIPVLGKVARLATSRIVVETPYPGIQAEGSRFPLESLIEIRPAQRMNLATQNASALVWGSVPSPMALRIIMARFGFSLINHGLSAWPGRYISVFEPGTRMGIEFSEYTQGASAPIEPWAESTTYHGAGDTGAWTFDANVAQAFTQIARQNIPNYQIVQQKCLDVARKLCRPTDRILDVGCATGVTLLLLQANGFTNIVGIDSSPAMAEEASKHLKAIVLSDTLPDDLGAFKLVMANWTLHFIERRMDYIADIHRALEPGGALILTDKMQTGPLMQDFYRAFKRERGMTEEQIAAKERAIKDILVPRPLTDYLQVLQPLFRQVDILDASYGFTTLLAVK